MSYQVKNVEFRLEEGELVGLIGLYNEKGLCFMMIIAGYMPIMTHAAL